MNKYKQKIAELEERLNILRDKKRKVYSKYESMELENTIREINFLKTLEEEKTEQKDLVNIGDIVNIKILNDNFEETIKLVMDIEGNSNYLEVELSSPLGSAILNQKVGNIITYTVNDEVLEVLIISKDIDIKKKILN